MWCFVSVNSFNSTIHRAQVPLKIYRCVQINSVLYSSSWSSMLQAVINIDSLMRRHLCDKLHSGRSHLLFAHCSTQRSLASYSSKIVICASPPVFDAAIRKVPVRILPKFGTEKLEWWKILKICLFISTEFTTMMDEQTDRHHMAKICNMHSVKIFHRSPADILITTIIMTLFVLTTQATR